MANEIIVGPGETFTTISAAIAAAANFDTIRVKPGTYNEVVIINKPIQLHGAQSGVDARDRVGDESIITGSTPSGGIVQLLNNHIVVDGFTIANNNTGPGIRTSVSFSGYWVFNNIVQNNTFGLYIQSDGLTESQVIQNVFHNNNQPGAATGNGIYSDAGVQNLLIDSNRFTGAHANASINLIGSLAPAANIIISRNDMITDNSIALFDTTNVKIANNQMVDTQGSSIFFGGGTDRTDIESNSLLNSISNGIRVTDLVGSPNTNIRANLNRIEGNATAGLNISAGAYDDTPTNLPLDATNNWWGSSDGPAPIGTGDAVIDPDAVAIITPFLEANPIAPTCDELLAVTEQELSEVQAMLLPFIPLTVNRLRNPSFELGLAGWQTAGNVSGERSATADEGVRVAQLLPTQTSNAILSQMVRVTLQADFLGVEYSVRALENPPNAPVPISPALTVQILWYDNSFQLLRTDIVDQFGEGFLPVSLNWTRRVVATSTKPAGTIQARLRFIATEGSSSALQIDNTIAEWQSA